MIVYALRLSTALLLLLTPFGAGAEPPPFVTGIHAGQAEDGGIAVTWDAPEDNTAIDHYNVYYASKSILDGDGLWDDVQATESAVPAMTLKTFPPVQTLFISVLAVNADGEESPFFTEEAIVELSGAPPEQPVETTTNDEPPESEQAAPATPTAPAESFQLLNVRAVSATGVLLAFSGPFTLDEEHGREIVLIVTGSGTELPITKLVSKDATLLVYTDVQERGRPYKVTLSPDFIRGIGDVPLQNAQDPVLFLGHRDGRAALSGVHLRTGPEADGQQTPDVPTEETAGKPAKLPPTGFGILPLIAIAGGLLGGMKARRRKQVA